MRSALWVSARFAWTLGGRQWLCWSGRATLIEHLKTPSIGARLFGLVGMCAFADVGRRGRNGEDDPSGDDPSVVEGVAVGARS